MLVTVFVPTLGSEGGESGLTDSLSLIRLQIHERHGFYPFHAKNLSLWFCTNVKFIKRVQVCRPFTT